LRAEERLQMRVACIIPAFNEESTIAEIVRGALKHCSTIIVVDDQSQDLTAELSRKSGARVVTHILRLGAGAALSTGFRAALGTDADTFVTMDGDGQHDPREIPRLLEPIRNDEADIVLGSRLLGQHELMPLYKLMGNKALSMATSLASGVRITDSQSGFRAYKRIVLDFVMHKQRDYGWASEILILAAGGSFRIREVPISATYRAGQRRGAGVKDGFKILYSTIRPKSSAARTMITGRVDGAV